MPGDHDGFFGGDGNDDDDDDDDGGFVVEFEIDEDEESAVTGNGVDVEGHTETAKEAEVGGAAKRQRTEAGGEGEEGARKEDEKASERKAGGRGFGLSKKDRAWGVGLHQCHLLSLTARAILVDHWASEGLVGASALSDLSPDIAARLPDLLDSQGLPRTAALTLLLDWFRAHYECLEQRDAVTSPLPSRSLATASEARSVPLSLCVASPSAYLSVSLHAAPAALSSRPALRLGLGRTLPCHPAPGGL